MTDKVHYLPTAKNVLAERYRNAYERSERSRAEWIDATIEMAIVLAEARAGYDDNRAFSIWLAENDLDFHSHQDRAALINMAGDIELTRRLLTETERTSPQHIWDKEIKPRTLTHVSKTDPSPSPPPPEPILAPPVPETDEMAKTNPADSELTSKSAPEPSLRKSPLAKYPRAAEVHNIFPVVSRTAIAKAITLKRRDVWDLILQAIDAGFVTANNAVGSKKLTLRFLLPDADRKWALHYDLTDTKDRERVKMEVMPAAIANRDAILANPENAQQIIRAYWQRQVVETKLATAKAAMPSGEQEVIMFGVTLWPCLNVERPYTYGELATAVFSFEELRTMARFNQNNSPKSCGMIIRHSTKWFLQHVSQLTPVEEEHRQSMRRVLSLVHKLSRLFEESPDGRCDRPLRPNADVGAEDVG